MSTIKIGTRKSKLALWQAEYVQALLKAGGFDTQLVLQETRGDKILDVSISKIGSKGVFTEELEAMLSQGEIDIAVHSAKDMQSRLPDGFEIIAFMEREGVHDVVVSDQEINLHSPSVILGTSSTRRVALLKHFYPNIQIVEMRGNLQTRLEKMRNGDCDALVLAYAGVHRMGYGDLIRHQLEIDRFIPAVGQGSIAIEAHAVLDETVKKEIKKLLNHEDTASTLLAERAYLSELEGGCSIPVFALAKLAEGQIYLKGGIVSLDGTELIVRSVTGNDPVALGQQLAHEVLGAGGRPILEEIKRKI